MAVLNLTNLKKLKFFFRSLETFRKNPQAQFTTLYGGKITVSKAESLELLRSNFSSLSGEEFKDDNYLINFLSKPKNQEDVLSRLPKSQWEELSQEAVSLEKPQIETASMADQSTGGESGEQPMPAGESAGSMSGGGMPHLPSGGGSHYSGSRVTRMPAPKSGMEGGQGAGTAAINKAERLEAARKTPSIQTTRTSNPIPRPPAQVANAAKNLGSSAGISFKKGSGAVTRGLGDMAKGLGRGIVGPGLTSASNLLGKAGRGGINAFSSLSSQISGGGGAFGRGGITKSLTGKRVAIAFLVIFLIFGIFAGLLGSSSGVPTTATLPTTPITSDISSCRFGRAGDGEGNEISYKSPLLLSYIQEASNLTGIPPAVLAAFIRVETGTTVSQDDAGIKALSSIASCPRNPVDGGLGVMQLQPQGKLGHYEEGIANGARLIGKNYSDLTEEDYCDVRKNVIMGAGFILKKMQRFGYGDGTSWQSEWNTNKVAINSMTTGYYGCLRYGSSGPCSDPGRIHSYGDDVWNSMQSCQPSTGVATLPTTGSVTLDTIVNTANQITATLSKGSDDLFNVRPGDPGPYPYQCTYLVVDSYKAAGLSKLDRTSHGWVIDMKNFFASTPGYQVAPANTNVKSLRPGDIVILEGAGSPSNLAQHVSIIKSIEVKDDGSGTITTFDANNIYTNDKISVKGFEAQKAGTLSRYDITGFGQITAL